MKQLTFICALICLVAFTSTFSSCAGKSTAETTIDKNSKEYASAYICPMHCKDSGSDTAGKCPTCGMDYVANKDYKPAVDNHDGHNHDHDGHDHGSHDGHNH